jgi:hypothetical protein
LDIVKGLLLNLISFTPIIKHIPPIYLKKYPISLQTLLFLAYS